MVAEYRVRWHGFSAAHDTWEPEANINKLLLDRYWEMCEECSHRHLTKVETSLVEPPDSVAEVVEPEVVVASVQAEFQTGNRQFNANRHRLTTADLTCDVCGGTWAAGAIKCEEWRTFTSKCWQWHTTGKKKGHPCRKNGKAAIALTAPASGWPDGSSKGPWYKMARTKSVGKRKIPTVCTHCGLSKKDKCACVKVVTKKAKA